MRSRPGPGCIPAPVPDFAHRLLEPVRPDGTYVFLNSSTKENFESACSEIANRLRTVGESIDQPEED